MRLLSWVMVGLALVVAYALRALHGRVYKWGPAAELAWTTVDEAPPLSVWTVATANLHLMPLLSPAAQVRRVAAALAGLGATLLAVQECWEVASFTALRGALRKQFPYTVSGATAPEMAGSGLAVFSRLPVEFVAFRPFRRVPFPDNMVNKGVLTVRVAGLVVLVTHFSFDWRQPYKTHRHSCLLDLAAAVPRAEPYLLLGDLNIARGSPEYAELRGVLGGALDASDGDVTPTHEGVAVDHVWTRGIAAGERPTVVDFVSTHVSDHCAVVGTVFV